MWREYISCIAHHFLTILVQQKLRMYLFSGSNLGAKIVSEILVHAGQMLDTMSKIKFMTCNQ